MHRPTKIEFPGLPLAVYCEVAAHLRQVEGIEVNLISQSEGQFDYNQSQIEGLLIDFKPELPSSSQQQVERILAYYQNRYS